MTKEEIIKELRKLPDQFTESNWVRHSKGVRAANECSNKVRDLLRRIDREERAK